MNNIIDDILLAAGICVFVLKSNGKSIILIYYYYVGILVTCAGSSAHLTSHISHSSDPLSSLEFHSSIHSFIH